MGHRPVLPPRKSDWKEGTHQVGIFLRGPDGSVVQVTENDATPQTMENVAKAILCILKVEIPERT